MTDKQIAVLYCYNELGKTQKEIADFIGVSSQYVSQIIAESKEQKKLEELPETTIKTLRVSNRAKNALIINGIETLEQLVEVVKNDPLCWCERYIGFGKYSRKEVEDRLSYLGLI